MVESEGNMMKLKDEEKRVTIKYSRTLTSEKCGDWHGYQRHDRKILCDVIKYGLNNRPE